MQEQKKIALLIDCDNVSSTSIEGVIENLSKHGMVNIRHAHGDWNSSRLSGWMTKLHPNAIRPMQQFAYTTGKNATDSAMIIDAMDLLYAGNIDAFALMTSDSDFTPLVMRILESGLAVYGYGEKKTPQPFVDACSIFIYSENLIADVDEPNEIKSDLGIGKQKRKSRKELRMDTRLVRLLCTAVEQTSDDENWAELGSVGKHISNHSSFSPINYGYAKLGDLVRETELFKVKVKAGRGMYIKDARLD